MRVARYWGMTKPSEWDNTSEDEKAEMIAFYNEENRIASYDAIVKERKQIGKNRSSRNL